MTTSVPHHRPADRPAPVSIDIYADAEDRAAGTARPTPRPAGSGQRTHLDGELLKAVIGLSAQLDLETVLRRLVQASTELTGAKYGAMSVLDSRGHPSTFIHTGVGPHAARMMESNPHGLGVLGHIPATGSLRLDNLREHPAFRGFPAHHPIMESFLGAPVRVRSEVYGHLYLADKAGGFDDVDDELVTALAAAAAVAIENAELYESSQKRERWLAAGSEITTMLLTGADEEDALQLIAERARAVAQADTAALVLPTVGGRWMLELAEGVGAQDLIGTIMPPDGRSMTVLREGSGLVVESLSRTRTLRVDALRRFGPAMYAPMFASGRAVGVLLLLRQVGSPRFAPSELATAESFAAQAALALVLAESRHAQDVASLVDERERIARDLHDMAIQQLFATGMQLETVRRRAARGVDATELTDIVDSALNNVDETVKQIRQIIHALHDPDANVGVVERLRREASLARTGLGFAPSLVISINSVPVSDAAPSPEDGETRRGDEDDAAPSASQVEALVHPDLADDVVAVVREGLANAARHAQSSSVQIKIDIELLEAPDKGARNRTGRITIRVEDDGSGMATSTGRRSGLLNLEARARRHNGTFALEQNAEGGTTLRWDAQID